MENIQYNPQQLETTILENMGLVVSIAKSLRPRNETELEEYIQVGTIGLWKAIKQYNPNLASLSTLAWNYIKWEILRYVNKNKRYYSIMNNPDVLYARQKIENERASNLQPYTEYFELIPNTLSKSERITVDMRNQGYTFEEIGESLGGHTKGWAHKLFKSAIRKIQDANKKTNING